MAEGFIDGALITSALTFLNLGRNASRPLWHQQSILETTYLMLHDNIHIIPRPRGTGGEHGDYAIVAQGFRELVVDSVRRREVFDKTFEEADQNYETVKSAWERSEVDDDFRSWADVQRHDRWKNQILTYGGLFDAASISMISKVSGFDEGDVKRVHRKSADPNQVKKWIRAPDVGDGPIANAGWVIGGFMRGFFYSNLAAAEQLQLLTHPFRSAIQHPLSAAEQHDVTNSEEILVKILIANALTERTKARRVHTWTATVKKARDFINTEKPLLPATTQAEAEFNAIQVAQRLDLQGGPRDLRWGIDLSLTLAAKLVGFSLSPWIPIAILAYRELVNKTPGEQIGDALLKSSYQFRWLASSLPGRIERTLPTPRKEIKREMFVV